MIGDFTQYLNSIAVMKKLTIIHKNVYTPILQNRSNFLISKLVHDC